jgi:hypothetical protein
VDSLIEHFDPRLVVLPYSRGRGFAKRRCGSAEGFGGVVKIGNYLPIFRSGAGQSIGGELSGSRFDSLGQIVPRRGAQGFD